MFGRGLKGKINRTKRKRMLIKRKRKRVQRFRRGSRRKGRDLRC